MCETLFLEDDGDICIDWCTDAPAGKRDMLTLSLRADGRLAYAVLLADGTASYGASYLPPMAFGVLRKLVPNDRVEGRDACGASLSHGGLCPGASSEKEK